MKEPCPRCGMPTQFKYPSNRALSRSDNKTNVCSLCGVAEAMYAYQHKETETQKNWWITRERRKNDVAQSDA